jgi:hypothetical protein
MTLNVTKTLFACAFAATLAAGLYSQPGSNADFEHFVASRFAGDSTGEMTPDRRREIIAKICSINDSPFARRIFSEYGSMFAAANVVALPPKCMFRDEKQVLDFRQKTQVVALVLNGVFVILQKAAADSLREVLMEAQSRQIRLTPLDGSIAGGRNYWDTVRLWNSRFQPALQYWVRSGSISADEAALMGTTSIEQQVDKVIEWESRGLWFGTGRRGSIFSSTAPPGASQHLALIAFDVTPPITNELRSLLNARGWYQTVKGDQPHFTFLGLPESELPKRGLIAVLVDGTRYWLPNLSDAQPRKP